MHGKQPAYRGPDGVKLYIDHDDCDTPAIVELGRATATYDCATATGELDNSSGEPVFLNDTQLAWLEPFRAEVDAAYQIARQGMPQYE